METRDRRIKRSGFRVQSVERVPEHASVLAARLHAIAQVRTYRYHQKKEKVVQLIKAQPLNKK